MFVLLFFLLIFLQALADYRIVGLPTNIEFVRRCARHPSFVNADLDINFIEKHQDSLLPSTESVPPSSSTLAMAALASLLEDSNGRRGDATNETNSPWSNPNVGGLRLSGALTSSLQFEVEGLDEGYEVEVHYHHNGDGFNMTIGGEGEKGETMSVTGTYDAVSGDVVTMIDGARHTGTVVRNGSNWHVFPDGEDVTAADGTGASCGRHMYTLKVPVVDHLSGSSVGGASTITTPMPGKVVKVSCAVGDVVKKGEALLILEAMKMEHVIRSPADGMVVARLPFAVGEQVDDGSVLVAFEEEDEE